MLILEAVVANAESTYGKTYTRTLGYRRTYIEAVAATSEPGVALGLARELVLDCRDVLGADHLLTYKVRYLQATLTAETGDGVAAAQLFEALHADTAQALGADHWLAADIRQHFKAVESAETDAPLGGEASRKPSDAG